MSDITFHAATREDVEYISDNLRSADYQEFVAATGKHPYPLLVNRALASDAIVAKLNGVPVAVFGCVPQGTHGAPWLLGTDELKSFAVARAMLEQGRQFFKAWVIRYGELRHRAFADNALHLRYIEALGCEIDEEAHPYGPYNALFKEFRYA